MTTYEKFVKEESMPYMTDQYCIIGIGGEAGEVLEFYKKYVLKGNNVKKPLEEEDLILELGDVLFYLTKLASIKGYSLQQVMDLNIKKHKSEKKDKKKK